MVEHSSSKNSSDLNDEHWNVKFDLDYQIPSLFDVNILISSEFQVFTSLVLCILASIGALFHTGILIRHYFHRKSCSHPIFIQSLFDSCHLINISFTHTIICIKTSTDIDLHCPLSIFFFSLASFGSTSFLCLGAFNQYMYLFKKQTQYRSNRHRLLAHRFILITSISCLILNFPKFDFSDIYFLFSCELPSYFVLEEQK